VAQGDDMVPRVVCRRDEARQSLVVLGGVEAVCVVAYHLKVPLYNINRLILKIFQEMFGCIKKTLYLCNVKLNRRYDREN